MSPRPSSAYKGHWLLLGNRHHSRGQIRGNFKFYHLQNNGEGREIKGLAAIQLTYKHIIGF